MLKAVTRSARAVDDKITDLNSQRLAEEPGKRLITVAQFFDHHATDADLDVLVTEEDFRLAKDELVPSVSQEELGHYERVRKEFEGGQDKKAAQNGSAGGQGLGLSGAEALPDKLPADATPEEVERWQAKRIEALIANGFKDGTLARNDPKGKGKVMMRGASPLMGNGFSGDDGSSGTGLESRESSRATDDDADEDGDLVVRTGQLTVNGTGNGDRGDARHSRFFGSGRDSKGKGKENDGKRKGKSRTMGLFSKGKGKKAESDGDFGDAARDKDLYD